jgi:hypothetical protein
MIGRLKEEFAKFLLVILLSNPWDVFVLFFINLKKCFDSIYYFRFILLLIHYNFAIKN